MRITLDIDDDVLRIAMQMAAKEARTTGAVLSDLVRRGLRSGRATESGRVRHGVEILPPRGEMVTIAHVQCLMGDEGI